MSSLAKLQGAKSLDDLAAILGYKPAALAYLLYHLPAAQKYTTFDIPKRDGTPRTILAPTPIGADTIPTSTAPGTSSKTSSPS